MPCNLGGSGSSVAWTRDDEWDYLRTYIMTTTGICGQSTVGEPHEIELYANRNGQRVYDTDEFFWISKELHPTVKGRQFGTAFGIYKPV